MIRAAIAFSLFVLSVSATVGNADPLLQVNGLPSTVPADFCITGTALNSDVVHVWGFPSSGAVFLGAGYTSQADTQMKQPAGSFSILVTQAPIGTYPVVVYAHDPSTGTFPTQVGQTITVRACNNNVEYRWYAGPIAVVNMQFTVCR